MTNKTNTQTGPLDDENLTLSGVSLYDEVMQQIEPDLLSTNKDTIDQPYAGETDEQKKIRYEHYDYAMQMCDDALVNFQMDAGILNASESEGDFLQDINTVQTLNA